MPLLNYVSHTEIVSSEWNFDLLNNAMVLLVVIYGGFSRNSVSISFDTVCVHCIVEYDDCVFRLLFFRSSCLSTIAIA